MAVTSEAEWYENHSRFKVADETNADKTVVTVRDSDHLKEASNCISGKVGKVLPPIKGFDLWECIFT